MRPRRGKHEQAVCSYEACGQVFWRRGVDLRRSPRVFCSCSCRNKAFTAGRQTLIFACSAPGCLEIFTRWRSEAKKHLHQYCCRACYMSTVDRVALGRLAAGAPRRLAPPLVRFMRAQRGGIERARRLSPERQREIGLLGAAARRAGVKKAARAPRRALGWVDPVVLRASGRST